MNILNETSRWDYYNDVRKTQGPKKAYIKIFKDEEFPIRKPRYRWTLHNQNGQVEAQSKPQGFGSLKGATAAAQRFVALVKGTGYKGRMKNYSGPARILIAPDLTKSGKYEVVQEHDPLNFFYVRRDCLYLWNTTPEDRAWIHVATPNVGDACAFGELAADIFSERYGAEKVLVTDV